MVKIIKSWGVNWVKSTSKDDKPQEKPKAAQPSSYVG